MINAILLNSKLPFNLCDVVLLGDCHIVNRILSKKNKISSYKTWLGRKLNINYFKAWDVLLIV